MANVPASQMTAAAAADVRYDRYAFQIHGQRQVLRAGAMHYFRLPHPGMWQDRLFKLKSAGYNTVDLYFPWSFHSPAPGVYNFSGNRDVSQLLAITQALGLWVIARPGPYINAELSGGGLPGWLLCDPEILPRHRNRQGQFQWSEPYMAAVRQWWKHIVPYIAKAPNVVLMQIENEYATADLEPDYMQALYELARELGVTVPLMHNDLYAAGLYEDIVDVYAFDHYPVTNFAGHGASHDWREDAASAFSVVDTIEDQLRPYCANRPLMVAELQAGWFSGWQGAPYPAIRESLGRTHLSLITKSLLGQGVTAFNHYMAIGGTNWDYLGGTDVLNSYDFAAPIPETGIVSDAFWEAKALNQLLQHFDWTATERVSIESTTLPFQLSGDTQAVYAIRRHVLLRQAYWLVLRNLTSQPMTLYLDQRWPLQLQPFEAQLLPYHLPLLNGFRLMRSTVEPLYQSASVLVLKGDRAVALQLLLDEARFVELQQPRGISTSAAVKVERQLDTLVNIFCPALASDAMESVTLGTYHVFLLGSALADRFWVQDDGFLVIGPDVYLSQETHPAQGGMPASIEQHYGVQVEDTALLSGTAPPLLTPLFQQAPQLTLIAPHGAVARERGFEPMLQLESAVLPTLRNWKATHAAPELFTLEGFRPVSVDARTRFGPRLDFDALGFYEGCAWYHVPFEAAAGDGLVQVSIDARHLWALYLNGTLVTQGLHWQPEPGLDEITPQDVLLPRQNLHRDKPNDLVIFVDGLGHPKGFHDDAQTPQGLLHLTLKQGQGPLTDLRSSALVAPGLSLWKAPFKQWLGIMPEKSPVVQLETSFRFDWPAHLVAALALDIANVPADRVNIHLNGTLVGRYWQGPTGLPNQTRFYLPEGLLRPGSDKENTLALSFIRHQPMYDVSQAASRLAPCVQLVPAGAYLNVRL